MVVSGLEPEVFLGIALLIFTFHTLYKRNKIWGDIAFIFIFLSFTAMAPKDTTINNYEDLIGFLGAIISIIDLGWNIIGKQKNKTMKEAIDG